MISETGSKGYTTPVQQHWPDTLDSQEESSAVKPESRKNINHNKQNLNTIGAARLSPFESNHDVNLKNREASVDRRM